MDKWNNSYKNLTINDLFDTKIGDSITFNKGFDWLHSCDTIEDWGCGSGGFKRLFVQKNPNILIDQPITKTNKYIGIDGSITPFADIKTDLVNYKSNVEGIFLRHVLEHNYQWKEILINACSSFSEKFCLVLFTPFSDITKEINHNLIHGIDVPDLSFKLEDITDIISLNNCIFTYETIITDTAYNVEHIFYITRKNFLCYYTSFTGTTNNNACRIPPIPTSKYDCYFFTNNPVLFEYLQHTKWIRIFMNDCPLVDDLDISCMQHKHIKTCPHLYDTLKNYTFTIYIDSKFGQINHPLIENLISQHSLNHDLLMRKHIEVGNNIYEEFYCSLLQPRYLKDRFKYEAYAQGQINNGLKAFTTFHVMCGFIVRKMKSPIVNQIGEEWYKQIKLCGIQDQISFFFVKQLFNYETTIKCFSEYIFTT